jgi:acetyltransferase-like isoleucine patch superfamily enzyme
VANRSDEISILRPRIAMKSVYLSLKHQRNGPGRFPIRAAPSAKMVVGDGANVKLGGRLLLGMAPEATWEAETDFAPQSDQSSALIVRSRGTFETKGWVVISPGAQVIVAPGGHVTLGEGYLCSVDSTIICNESITIGNGGGISWGVMVMDSNFHPIWVGDEPLSQNEPVTIGDRVYVGARSLILKGADIGSDTIIAAGSVVTGKIPPNVIAGGVPAKVLRENVRWSME